MSIAFSLTNTQTKKVGLFSLKKKRYVMTLAEIRALAGQDYVFYDIDEEKDLASIPLSEAGEPSMGWEGQSVRGFVVYTEDEGQRYCVRLNTPAAICDWQAALAFLQKLARHLNTTILDENGTVYAADEIANFDYLKNIEYGLHVMSDRSEDSVIWFYCVKTRVDLSTKRMRDWLAQPNPAQAMTDYLLPLQNLDAHYANQILMKRNKEGRIIGVYVCTAGLRLILPLQAALELHNRSVEVEHGEIAEWHAILAVPKPENDDIDILGHYRYDEFIAALPDEVKQPFGDGHLVVNIDSKTLRELAVRLTPIDD